jgi:hypothetical protein
MEIHRAQSLGLLAQKLGIKPDARISYRMTQSGVVIWDLSTGNEYTVNHNNPNAIVSSFSLPTKIKQIIDATDDDLKKRYSASWMDGWSDERETMFTELTYRGINTLGL